MAASDVFAIKMHAAKFYPRDVVMNYPGDPPVEPTLRAHVLKWYAKDPVLVALANLLASP